MALQKNTISKNNKIEIKVCEYLLSSRTGVAFSRNLIMALVIAGVFP